MSTVRSPWVYLFHGEDDLSSREAVQGLVARMMKDSPMWEFNIASFDGDKLALEEMVNTCQTVPFLSDKRLVVVANLIGRLGDQGRPSASAQKEEGKEEKSPRGSKKALLEGLLAFLPQVPDSTRLVFLEEGYILDRDPVLKAIRAMGGYVKAHRLEEGGLAYWIRDRAARIGCRISNEAVDELAAAVGPNARLLNGELLKMATYRGEEMIRAEDVEAMVSDARKANVFAMVDAVGLRQPEAALNELRKLLAEGDHPLRITAMLVRQYRLLIQVKELTEAGCAPDEIAQKAGAPYRGVAGLQRQARHIGFEQMERAYQWLLEYDLQVKTGLRDPEAALELLVMELVRG